MSRLAFSLLSISRACHSSALPFSWQPSCSEKYPLIARCNVVTIARMMFSSQSSSAGGIV